MTPFLQAFDDFERAISKSVIVLQLRYGWMTPMAIYYRLL